MRVRVLHVIGSSAIGGAERNLAALLEALPRDRVESHVDCQGQGPMFDEYRRLAASARSYPLGLIAPLALAHRIAELRPQIVHTRLWTADAVAGIAARLGGKPAMVATIEGNYFRADDVTGVARGRRSVASRVYRSVYRLFDRVVAVSEATAEDLIRRAGLKVSRERIIVIPTGIDAATAAQSACGAQVPGGASAWSRPRLVCVANLFPIKGHEVLLAAMVLVRRVQPTAHLLLVGDGPLRQHLQQFVATLGLDASVTLLGERRDALGLIHAADVVVLPSNSEGTPRVLLEALSLGRPIVATAVGGVPELLQGGQVGRLVPPRNPAAMAAALCAVLDEAEATAGMCRRGQLLVEQHYSARGMAERVEALDREVLDQRPRPRTPR